MNDVANNKEDRLIKLFRYLFNHQEKYRKDKQNDEEFYFADVEGTRSQFTKAQLKTIQEKHDIPISTKLSFSIVEHFRSFLSGSEPYPRLIAVEEKHKPWTSYWERVNSSIWYESAIQHELDQAIKEMAVVGTGFLRVRHNHFYKESTFNVIADCIPWYQVYVDPSSQKDDYTDADVICIARSMPMLKAEKEYGITLNLEDDYNTVDPTLPDSGNIFGAEDYGFWSAFDATDDRKRTKQVWAKEFYLKEVTTEYISPEGYVSLTPPMPTSTPNPQKMELMEYAQSLQAEMEQMPQGESPEDMAVREEQFQPIMEELQQIEQAMATMPDYVPAFRMMTEAGDEVIIMTYSMRKKKRIKYVLQISKKIIKEDLLPTDEFPVVPFHFSHFRNPHRTFGVVHYIKDIVKALNKLWALLIYDMQLKNSLRIMAPTNSIQDLAAWESKFSTPGSINLFDPDPTLKNDGQPEIIIPSETASQVPAFISMLVNLAEYITGIFGVMQGNQEGAPSTFGATQALQSFGTQRIKMTARQIERPLNLLIYNIVVFAQHYAPREKLEGAMDPEQHAPSFEQIIASSSDARYKVRTTITKSLPTSRQMAANMFMILAGQVADPALQQLLAREGIKFLDVLETDKLSEKMDMVTELQGHIQQLEEQVKEGESKMNIMKNNAAQQEAAKELEKAKGDIKAAQAVAENDIKNQAEQVGEQTNV